MGGIGAAVRGQGRRGTRRLEGVALFGSRRRQTGRWCGTHHPAIASDKRGSPRRSAAVACRDEDRADHHLGHRRRQVGNRPQPNPLRYRASHPAAALSAAD